MNFLHPVEGKLRWIHSWEEGKYIFSDEVFYFILFLVYTPLGRSLMVE
jgi:hypothetical protein